MQAQGVSRVQVVGMGGMPRVSVECRWWEWEACPGWQQSAGGGNGRHAQGGSRVKGGCAHACLDAISAPELLACRFTHLCECIIILLCACRFLGAYLDLKVPRSSAYWCPLLHQSTPHQSLCAPKPCASPATHRKAMRSKGQDSALSSRLALFLTSVQSSVVYLSCTADCEPWPYRHMDAPVISSASAACSPVCLFAA